MARVEQQTYECPLTDEQSAALSDALSWTDTEKVLGAGSSRKLKELQQRVERNRNSPRFSMDELAVCETALIFEWGLARGAHEDDKRTDAEDALEAVRSVIARMKNG